MKISIITINYNNGDGLQTTMNSVLMQTYTDIEYIVIDGGSRDSSKSIIEMHQEKLYYWVIEQDNGIYNAMNKGIRVATGDYLLFLNSGDVLCKDNVIQEAVANNLDKDLVYGNLLCVNENERYIWEMPDILTFGQFYFQGMPHPATFIKSSLFDIVGLYDENFNIVSDWKFFLLAVCKLNCTYKHINITIAEFDEGGVSSDPNNSALILKERDEVLKADFKTFLADYEELSTARLQLKNLKLIVKLKALFRLK